MKEVNGKSNIHHYRPDGVKTQDRETRTVMTIVTSVDSLGNTITTLKGDYEFAEEIAKNSRNNVWFYIFYVKSKRYYPF